MMLSSPTARISAFFVALAIVSGAAFLTRNWLHDSAGLALKEGDYQRARERLKPLAHVGDPLAQQFMGDFYAYGWGVQKDDQTAIYWFRRAGRAAGNVTDPAAESMFFVGKRYLGGQGVRRDEIEARKWFQLAKDGGYSEAETELHLLR